MKLYFEITKLLFKKIILRKQLGELIKDFAESMGVVYIKFAQMLAMQNYGNLFSEDDRVLLSSICDNCNPLSYEEVLAILKEEYGNNLDSIFKNIEIKPLGSASISQVHKATLTNGEEVALKIKRRNVDHQVSKEINRLKKLMHRFGKIIKFKNYTGGEYGLELFLKWIKEEIDLDHERENIKKYQSFTNLVNDKIKAKQISVPKVYEEYSTSNVLVMEFISAKTINQMELTEENKTKIREGINSYIRLSFWALLNSQTVIFHSDPHSGNICVDDTGNIIFLDMGLIYELNKEESALCREFFLAAYSKNYEKLFEMLMPFGNMNENQKTSFKKDCQKYCQELKEKEVTNYFVDMINICFYYEIVPPKFLFSMAKAFICLNGISKFSDNKFTAEKLLQDQISKFLLKRSYNDFKGVIKDGLELTPIVIGDLMENGVEKAISNIITNPNLHNDIRNTLINMKETLMILKASYQVEEDKNKSL